MKKRELIDALSYRLRSLPKEEINRTITYYNEIIEDYIESGMTEEEAVAQVEDVDAIAEKILRDVNHPDENQAYQPVQTAQQPTAPRQTKRWTWVTVLLAVLGFPIWFPLLVALFSVSFSVIAALFSIMISIFSIPIGLAAGAVAGVVVSPVLFATGNVAKGFVLLGGGLICGALAIVFVMVSVWLVKWIWRLICLICRSIKRLFTRKRKAVA